MTRYCFPVIAAQMLWLAPAHASTFGFHGITANDLADVAIGEAQLTVEVTDPGSDQVLFTFSNSGPDASSITDVYFDDGPLLGISLIDDSDPGVAYTEDAKPGNLPSGNGISPSFDATFSADSDSGPNGVQANGVNPGEWLGVLFDLKTGQTFDDMFAQLASGDLRIGIHVQGFDGGGSESFVNNLTPVPLPATVWLLGSALAALMGLRYRRRREQHLPA